MPAAACAKVDSGQIEKGGNFPPFFFCHAPKHASRVACHHRRRSAAGTAFRWKWPELNRPSSPCRDLLPARGEKDAVRDAGDPPARGERVRVRGSFPESLEYSGKSKCASGMSLKGQESPLRHSMHRGDSMLRTIKQRNKKGGKTPPFSCEASARDQVSGESWISTRRFWARPSAVALVAIGRVLPKPLTAKRRWSTPCPAR